MNKRSGFTIVELLVVIVVIGILAAITFVSYSGIQQRSRIAVLKSDLKNSYTRLSLDYTTNGDAYPLREEDVDSGRGLPKSQGTSYAYTATSSSFCLAVASSYDSSLKYYISSDTGGEIETGNCAVVWKEISAGWNHTCALASNGLVYCWGYNYYGQLGNNSVNASETPVAVSMVGELAGKKFKSISAGHAYTCGISSDDYAYCWGFNSLGEIGNNSVIDSHFPVPVYRSGSLNGLTVKSISAGAGHTCAIASDNNAYCWGSGGHGELGTNPSGSSSFPVAVDRSGNLSGKSISSIDTKGTNFTCATSTESRGYCWGYNEIGQLGDNTGSNRPLPTEIYMLGALSGKTVLSISANGAHACAIASDNIAYCWGENNYGQLGINSASQYRLGPNITYMAGALNNKTVKSVTTGLLHTCAIASDNNPYCWGQGSYAQIGDGNYTEINRAAVAVNIAGALSGKSVKKISSGEDNYSCVIASDNQAYCWGQNTNYQLGNGSVSYAPTPMLVPSPPQ